MDVQWVIVLLGKNLHGTPYVAHHVTSHECVEDVFINSTNHLVSQTIEEFTEHFLRIKRFSSCNQSCGKIKSGCSFRWRPNKENRAIHIKRIGGELISEISGPPVVFSSLPVLLWYFFSVMCRRPLWYRYTCPLDWTGDHWMLNSNNNRRWPDTCCYMDVINWNVWLDLRVSRQRPSVAASMRPSPFHEIFFSSSATIS